MVLTELKSLLGEITKRIIESRELFLKVLEFMSRIVYTKAG
jgi:hypothetical protein